MGDKIVRVLKKNLVAIITIVISMGVLLYFLFTTDGITALGHLVSSMRWEWLLITLGAMVGGWLLETYVLGVFCKHLYPKWKFSQSFHIAMTGLLYSALTPFATGGQPMQMYSMSKMGMDTGKAGSIVAMKTLVYQALMVVYAMVMVIFRLGYFQRKISNFSFPWKMCSGNKETGEIFLSSYCEKSDPEYASAGNRSVSVLDLRKTDYLSLWLSCIGYPGAYELDQ